MEMTDSKFILDTEVDAFVYPKVTETGGEAKEEFYFFLRKS